MATKTLQDLFVDTLRDVYYAENQILKTLPKLAEAATTGELKAAFEKHLTETQGQVERLERVFKIVGEAPKGKKCDGIEGILKEGDSAMAEFAGSDAADASLISSAQAVEHYEITRYGTLCRWAEVLGLPEAVDLLSATLDEESNADETLTRIADAAANPKAAS